MTELKPSEKVKSILLILIGLAWTVITGANIGGPIQAILTYPGRAEIDWSPLALLLFPATGLVIAAIGIYPWIAWLRVARPEITIDKTAAGVGEDFTVSYSQNFKRRSEVRGIQLSLVMRESAHHRAGKNSHTYHHEETIAQYDHPGQTYKAGDTLAFSQTMGIPKSGMHSFQAINNSIDWELRVKVDIAGWPDYREDFEIQVQPILAR